MLFQIEVRFCAHEKPLESVVDVESGPGMSLRTIGVGYRRKSSPRADASPGAC